MVWCAVWPLIQAPPVPQGHEPVVLP